MKNSTALTDLQATLRYEARKNGKIIHKKDRSKKYLIPFDAEGNQLYKPVPEYSFDAYGRMKLNMKSIVWKSQFTFHDTIRLEKLNRGRASAYFTCISTTSMLHYTLFLHDLLNILHLTDRCDHGEITGTWEFIKRGEYFGIRLASERQTSGLDPDIG